MKWAEAEQFLIRGKRIRRPTFSNENYWYLENNIIMNGSTKDKAYVNIKVLNADDWYVVEDKKTLSDKATNIEEIFELILNMMEENMKKSVKESGFHINVDLNEKSVNTVKAIIKNQFCDEFALDGGDVKEAIKSYKMWLFIHSDIKQFKLEEGSKEIFGERLI